MQREIIQNWAHTLDMTLRAHYGATEGKAIFKLHSHTFSSVYQEKFDPEVAVLDIVHIDSLQNKAKVALNLYKDLLDCVENASVYLEEYARTMIGQEEQHTIELKKMLKDYS